MVETDPFAGIDLGEDDDDDEGVTPQQTSKPFNDLRKALRAAKKAIREKDAALAEAETFITEVKTERRTQALETTFKEAQLDPTYAKLFEKVAGAEAEVTVDAVKSFASEYKLPTLSGETVETPEVKPEGFTPVVTGQGGELKKYSPQEALELVKGDPVKFQQLREAGRVELLKLPGNEN